MIINKMKNKDVEKIYNACSKVPKSLSLDLKKKLFRNRQNIISEHSFIQDMRQNCTEEELRIFLNEEVKNQNLEFINIEELPDDINEFEQEFLDGIFLITN